MMASVKNTHSVLRYTLLTIFSLVVIVVSFFLFSKYQENQLKVKSFTNLTQHRINKKKEIEELFFSYSHNLQTLSNTPEILKAFHELDLAFNNIEVPDSITKKKFATYGYGQGGEWIKGDKLYKHVLNYYSDHFTKSLFKKTNHSYFASIFMPQSPKAIVLQNAFFSKKYYKESPNSADYISYIKDYKQVHTNSHLQLENLQEKFGFYDIFFINLDGDIFYSVKKEVDFATNLIEGPYRQSGLANIFMQSLKAKKDVINIHDFSKYNPSLGAPALFMSIPVFSGEKNIGVIAVQIPTTKINEIMSFNMKWQDNKLQQTGEVYLVGDDYLMRNDSRFLLEEPRRFFLSSEVTKYTQNSYLMKQFATTILLQNVSSNSVEFGLKGESGNVIIKDYRGVDVLSSYSPLNIEGLNWVILAEQDLSEVLQGKK